MAYEDDHGLLLGIEGRKLVFLTLLVVNFEFSRLLERFSRGDFVCGSHFDEDVSVHRPGREGEAINTAPRMRVGRQFHIPFWETKECRKIGYRRPIRAARLVPRGNRFRTAEKLPTE